MVQCATQRMSWKSILYAEDKCSMYGSVLNSFISSECTVFMAMRLLCRWTNEKIQLYDMLRIADGCCKCLCDHNVFFRLSKIPDLLLYLHK